jgi:hypothetical protein
MHDGPAPAARHPLSRPMASEMALALLVAPAGQRVQIIVLVLVVPGVVLAPVI